MSKISMFVLAIIIILTVVLFIIPQFGSPDIIEGIGGGGHGGGHGGGGRHMGGIGRRGGRRWYGENRGYGYRPPLVDYGRRYIPWWTTAYWFTGDCKDGCTNIGNNNWGCQYPGNGPNDCIFARDCMGCGF